MSDKKIDHAALIAEAQAMLLDSEVGTRADRGVVMAKLVVALEASARAPKSVRVQIGEREMRIYGITGEVSVQAPKGDDMKALVDLARDAVNDDGVSFRYVPAVDMFVAVVDALEVASRALAFERLRKVDEALEASVQAPKSMGALSSVEGVAGANAVISAPSTPAVDVEKSTSRHFGSALSRFVESFNGDEAGDIDYMEAADGANGWAMRGGNDVEAVFGNAIAALVASGVLLDAAEVEARGLEKAADAGHSPLLRGRAQHVREGNK